MNAPWRVLQGLAGVGMIASVGFLVTGWMLWMATNVLAGVVAVAAAAKPSRSAQLATIALALYAPLTGVIAVINLASAPRLMAPILVLVGLQVGLVVWAWRTSRGVRPT